MARLERLAQEDEAKQKEDLNESERARYEEAAEGSKSPRSRLAAALALPPPPPPPPCFDEAQTFETRTNPWSILIYIYETPKDDNDSGQRDMSEELFWKCSWMLLHLILDLYCN